MPAGTTWGLLWVHYRSSTSHSAPPSVLLSQMCVCAHISLFMWLCDPPLSQTMSAEPRHVRETQGPEAVRRLHKPHSSARTPCFHTTASIYWKTEGRKVRDGERDRQIVCYVCSRERLPFSSTHCYPFYPFCCYVIFQGGYKNEGKKIMQCSVCQYLLFHNTCLW